MSKIDNQVLNTLEKILSLTKRIRGSLKTHDIDIFIDAVEKRQELMEAYDALDQKNIEAETKQKIIALFKEIKKVDDQNQRHYNDFYESLKDKANDNLKKVNDVKFEKKVKKTYSGVYKYTGRHFDDKK